MLSLQVVLRRTLPCVAAALGACASSPPPTIPAVPSAVHAPVRSVPTSGEDSVEISRASAGRDDVGRMLEQGGQAGLPADTRLVVDLADAAVEPATAGAMVEQHLLMAFLAGGREVLERSALGAELRSRDWTANHPRVESFDLADVLWLSKGEEDGAAFVVKVRRLHVAAGESRDVDLSGVPDVREFLARNPGLEIPTTIRVPTMVGHLDLQLVDVATGRVRWVGSVSADLIDALGDAAKVRITCTRTVTNADAVRSAVADHNARVDAADASVREAWRVLAQAHKQRRGEDEIADLRARFDEAKDALDALATPPAETEQPWEYGYTSTVELATHLDQSEAADAAREAALIRHLARLMVDAMSSA